MAQSEEQIAEGVAKALIVAQEAVENDIEKEYVLAVQRYTDAVHQIAEIAGQLPSHLYKALYEKVRATSRYPCLSSESENAHEDLVRTSSGDTLLGTRHAAS